MESENMLKAKVNMFENFFDRISETMTEEQKKEWDKTVEEAEKTETEKFAQNRFQNCGIGSEYWNCSFDTFVTETEEQRKMKDLALQFCDYLKNGISKNMVFLGDCGTGKTHISAAILREFSGNVKTYAYDQPIYSKIRYATVNEISDEFHDAESFNSSKSKESVSRSYRDYDILVIDEVGRLINKFESESDLLFRIIDARYQSGKSTILITNLDLDSLFELMNKATVSRLTGFNKLMFFDTKNINDYRQGGAA